jgi:citrate lyase subunit beta / citryl-CoA lyase
MTEDRLRSVLYVPGANERALEKARTLPADGLILDLEDAVAPDGKQRARELACAAAADCYYGERPVAIRINAIGTPWHEADLAAAAAARPTAIVVPKVGSADDVRTAEHALADRGDHETAVWAMLETPRAVLNAAEIAAAGDRLSVLVVGTNDLLAELRAHDLPDRGPLQASLMLCLLAARAAGRLILDGVYNDVGNSAGFEAECDAGRVLGFDGKTLIHPAQIDACNRSFTPSRAEVEHAQRVIDAFESAANAGNAVCTLDGRLIEELHVRTARRVIAAGAGAGSSN